MELRSCLVPGHDPLRPGVSIASYPAVLWPITDELGTSSAPLGASQPRASEGILDASMPPFSADPSGKTDSTAQLQARGWTGPLSCWPLVAIKERAANSSQQ